MLLLVLSSLVCGMSYSDSLNSGENQIALEPVLITCALTDIVIISAPVVADRSDRRARTYLTNPHGEVRPLNVSRPHYKPTGNFDIDTINIKFINKTKLITLTDNYKVFNVNFGQIQSWNKTEDTFGMMESAMAANDFMIGPVSEDDYGNWEVAVMFKNEKGEWAEAYQVITLDIIEVVPATPRQPKLKPGDSLELGFAYPIPHIQSCQLVVPKSSFDRFYDRDHTKADTCGYVVKNVSASDAGLWRIIGVGRIAYHASVQLTVT